MDTSWYPGNYRPDPAYPPHYSTMPASLRVVDAVAKELGGKRLAYWLKCRDAGLAQWKAVGVPVKLKARGALKDNRVSLIRIDAEADYGADKDGLHCFEACKPCKPGVEACDWVGIDRGAFERHFLSNVKEPMVYLVAHEFGHSLGFGHGGNGIMDQTPDHARVNAEEAAAVRAYWRL